MNLISKPISQLAFGGCQGVHNRFRVHPLIILDAGLAAALADKLFRNITSKRLTTQYTLPSRCIDTTTTHAPYSLLLYDRSIDGARMWHTLLPRPRDDHITILLLARI